MRAEALRQARLRRGWTQQELAEKVGRSQATISLIEKGRTDPSPHLLQRLERALQEPDRVSAAPTPSWVLPDLALDRTPDDLSVSITEWRRPTPSGDFLAALPLSGEDLLLVAVDIAGHGLGIVPISYFLQGWLRGWCQALRHPPRLTTLVEELSGALRSARVDASCFFALLSRQQGLPHTVSLETVCCGFPLPLLITGPPFRSLESGTLGRPLPSEDSATPAFRIDRLAAPWRLVISTDGLLSRLGDGDEHQGLRRLLKWQTSPLRDATPENHLDATAPLLDDELFAIVRWEAWDLEVTFASEDAAERHRMIDVVEHLARPLVGTARTAGLLEALTEAFGNAGRHGYGGSQGQIRVRCREEAEHLRIEVEDQGRGGVSDSKVRKPGSGFAVMRHWTREVEARPAPGGGTVVTLVVEKRELTSRSEK